MLSQVAKMALIGHNTVFSDIGSNIGNHSVYFGHILGVQTVVSCEPQPHVYKTLQRNLKLNGLATKNAFNVMLGDTSGRGKVARFDKQNHGTTQLKATADGPFEMVTLDALTARYAMIGFLKLDVEGFEALVPAGAKRILSVDRPHIWVELAIGEDNMKAARARLEAHNYTEQAQLSRTDFIFSPR